MGKTTTHQPVVNSEFSVLKTYLGLVGFRNVTKDRVPVVLPQLLKLSNQGGVALHTGIKFLESILSRASRVEIDLSQ